MTEAQEQVHAAGRQRDIARILLAALALGGLLVAASGCAPRTSVESVVVNASVDTFGTLEATEERTLVVAPGASITWDYTFRVGAVFEVVRVSGKGGDYVLAEDSAAKEPGTYTLAGDDDQMQIVAHPRPSDSAQTVTLTYRVQGVALRWNDTSEFSWRFLRDKEKSPIDSVRIHVTLPGEVSKDTVRAWANGPLYSDAVVNDDGSIDVRAADLPARTELEVRSLFPTDALPDRMVSPWKRVDDVVEYENDIAVQVAFGRFKDRARRAIGWVLGILAPVLGLAYALVYRYRHRDEFSPAFEGDYYRELPADIMPAMVAALMAGEVPPGGVLGATIADLVDRNVLALTCDSADAETCRLSRLPASETVSRSEKHFIAVLFDDVAAADTFTLGDLRARLSTDEGARAGDRLLGEFGDKAGDELVMRRYLEHRVTDAGTAFTWLAVVLVGVGLIARSMTGSLVPVALALVAAPIVAVLARTMRFVKQQADDLAGKYRGLRNFLRDLPSLDEPLPDSAQAWRQLLTLAVLFGEAGEVVRVLETRLTQVAAEIDTSRWLWAEEVSRISHPR